MDTAGPRPASIEKPRSSSWRTRSSRATSDSVETTAGDSALRISSSKVAGLRASGTAGSSHGAAERSVVRGEVEPELPGGGLSYVRAAAGEIARAAARGDPQSCVDVQARAEP